MESRGVCWVSSFKRIKELICLHWTDISKTFVNKQHFPEISTSESNMAFALLAMLVPLSLVACADAEYNVYTAIDGLNSSVAKLGEHFHFMATFNDILTLPTGTVVFNSVLKNTNNVYNPSTGVFTALQPGLYLFMVQMYTREAGDNTLMELQLNGKIVARWKDVTHDTSYELVYPLILSPRDRVSVFCHESHNIYGPYHSFFSGVLLKPL